MNQNLKRWIRIFWAFWPLFMTLFLVTAIVFSALASNYRPLATRSPSDYTNTTCIALDLYIENQTTVYLSRGPTILSRVVWVVANETANNQTNPVNYTAVWDAVSEGWTDNNQTLQQHIDRIPLNDQTICYSYNQSPSDRLYFNVDFSSVVTQFNLFLALAITFWGLLLLNILVPILFYVGYRRRQRVRPSPEVEELPERNQVNREVKTETNQVNREVETETNQVNREVETETNVVGTESPPPPKVEFPSPSETYEIPLPSSTPNNNSIVVPTNTASSNPVNPPQSPNPPFEQPIKETETDTNINAPPPPERTHW